MMADSIDPNHFVSIHRQVDLIALAQSEPTDAIRLAIRETVAKATERTDCVRIDPDAFVPGHRQHELAEIAKGGNRSNAIRTAIREAASTVLVPQPSEVVSGRGDGGRPPSEMHPTLTELSGDAEIRLLLQKQSKIVFDADPDPRPVSASQTESSPAQAATGRKADINAMEAELEASLLQDQELGVLAEDLGFAGRTAIHDAAKSIIAKRVARILAARLLG